MSLVGEAYRRSQGNPDPVRPDGAVMLSRRNLWLIIFATALCTSLAGVLVIQLRPASDSFEGVGSAMADATRDPQTSADALGSTNEITPSIHSAQTLDAADGRERSPSANGAELSVQNESEHQRVQDLYRARALDLSEPEKTETRSESDDPRSSNASATQVLSGLADVSQVSLSPVQNETIGDTGIDPGAILQRAQKLLQAGAVTRGSALPTIEELPEADRDGIPTLLYSAHDFQSAGESRVMINREWHSVGARITGRLTLRDIRESDIVIESDDGFRFIVPALASWVNL